MAWPPSTIAANKANSTTSATDHPNHHNALATAINDLVAADPVFRSELPWIDPHDSAYGAVGDGTTDDTAAIQAALDAAGAIADAAQGCPQGGATVQLRGQLYLISSTLTIPDGVALIGAGQRRTVIMADSGWVVGTDGAWMINLGPTNHVTSCSLEEMELNGNQVTDLVGWYSDSISEHSNIRGIRTLDCLGGAGITEWTGSGGSTGAANHFAVYDCDDILTVAGITNRKCWSFTGPSGSECTVRLARMTHHSEVGATWANAHGIYCLRVAPEASSLHMESCVIGIWVQSAEGCDIRTASGWKLPTNPAGTYYTVALHTSMTGKAVTLANIRRGAGNQVDHALFYDGANYTADIGLWVSGQTNILAADPEITAIAGLTSAADRLPYFTGSGTASLATFTAAGRNLVDDADTAAQRTTLGLAIGTDVQAYGLNLQAIRNLVSAADRIAYFTGAGTAALATFTAAGRALVDDADAAAQRTTLGLAIGTDVQAYDADLAALAGAGNSGVLAATTASFLTADETKLDGLPLIEVSDTAPGSPSVGDLWVDTTGII